MGIDIITCNLCNEGFMDAMDYGYCGTCEEVLCNRCNGEMQEKHGQVDEDSEFAMDYGSYNSATCDICTGETIEETEFVKFLVKKTGETRAAMEDAFRSSLKSAQTI